MSNKQEQNNVLVNIPIIIDSIKFENEDDKKKVMVRARYVNGKAVITETLYPNYDLNPGSELYHLITFTSSSDKASYDPEDPFSLLEVSTNLDPAEIESAISKELPGKKFFGNTKEKANKKKNSKGEWIEDGTFKPTIDLTSLKLAPTDKSKSK